MKLFNLLLISLFVAAFGSSCKKDKNDPPPAPQKTRLVKADFAGSGNYIYTYDATGNMAAEAYSGNASNPASATTFTNFDSKGRVTQYTRDFASATLTDEKTLVSYTADGKPDRVVFFSMQTGSSLGYDAFEYSAGKVISKSYSTSNTLTGSTEYTLTADGNNVAESKSYNATGGLRSTTVYGNYDDKTNYETLLPVGFYTRPISKNNYRSVAITNAVTSATGGFTATFEYNADGYATKRTTSSGAINTFEYVKQ